MLPLSIFFNRSQLAHTNIDTRGLLWCLRGTSSSSTPKYFEPLIFRDGILVQTGIVLDFPSPPVGSVPIKKIGCSFLSAASRPLVLLPRWPTTHPRRYCRIGVPRHRSSATRHRAARRHWGQHWASARHQGIGAMGAAPGLVAPGIAAGTERDGAARQGDRCARVSRS